MRLTFSNNFKLERLINLFRDQFFPFPSQHFYIHLCTVPLDTLYKPHRQFATGMQFLSKRTSNYELWPANSRTYRVILRELVHLNSPPFGI